MRREVVRKSRSDCAGVGEFEGVVGAWGVDSGMDAFRLDADVSAAGVECSSDIALEALASCSCIVSSRRAFAPASCRNGSIGSDMLVEAAEKRLAGSCDVARAVLALHLVKRTCDRGGRLRRRQ